MPRKKRLTRTILSPTGGTIKTNPANEVQAPDDPQTKLDALRNQFSEGSPAGDPEDGTGAEQEESKPRRGRRSNAEIEAAKNAELEANRAAYKEKAQAFAAMSGVVLDILCARLPNPIPPSPEEKEFFAVGVGAIAEKYLPQAGGYDAEISLAFAAVLILAPRLVKPQPEKKAAEIKPVESLN